MNYNGVPIPYTESGGVQTPTDPYVFRIYSTTDDKTSDKTLIWFTSTGNRWFTDEMADKLPKGTIGGQNFNPTISYLWSSTGIPGAFNNAVKGLALGKDYDNDSGQNDFVVCPLFGGRRALGRPIRPIRE